MVGYDEEADVALVQLEDASGLDAAPLDDDGDDDEVGDPVTAIGNARGQGSLSTVAGTITATEQAITTSPPDSESLSGLLETDAAAVPGYSGGPMLDDEGEVIAVTTAASSTGSSDSYGVPIEDALAVVEQIESGEEYGTVHIGPPAYLGISVTDDGDAGAPVAGVVAGGPAAEAGMETGDRITAVDGAEVGDVAPSSPRSTSTSRETAVELTWTHGGQERTATVTLDESPYA